MTQPKQEAIAGKQTLHLRR